MRSHVSTFHYQHWTFVAIISYGFPVFEQRLNSLDLTFIGFTFL